MQTILGANGIIAFNLAKDLTQYTHKIRLVSRNPRKVNDTDELFSADLLDAAKVDEAVKGSEIVYLTAGLKYDIKVWRVQWPMVMTNVINACKKHKAKLVFFDNVYAYGKVDGWMTEATPYNPCSKKGEVRKAIAEQLMNEVKSGALTAMIIRSADFYGPNTATSFLNVLVFDKLKNKKAAQLLGSADTLHSVTYTPDAAKATALLGNTPEAYNQVWHAPTDKHTITAKQFIEKAAALLNVPAKYTVLPKFLMSILGIFIGVLRESKEMLYQNENDYLFSSDKFETAFPLFRVTTYDEGIREIVGRQES